MLRINWERTAECTICSPVGELEAYTVVHFREALASLTPGDSVVIDLSGVTFVDSAGLGALIGGIRRARELGGDAAVACNRPAIIKLLRTTGFDRIVSLAEKRQEAILSLRPPGISFTEVESATG